MELATLRLQLDQYGSDVPKRDVTPAEALLLKAGFEQSANKMPLSEIVVTGESDISDADELTRLREVYYGLKQGDDRVVDLLFPGIPKLPQTFEDAGITVQKAV